MCGGEGIYTMKGEWYFHIFLGNFRLVSKTKRSRIKKVCILNIPAKQNICCGSRNVFYMQARLPAGWGRACYWVSAFRKLYKIGLIHWTIKNQWCNCHGKKKRKPTISVGKGSAIFSVGRATSTVYTLSRPFKSSRWTCGWKISTKERNTTCRERTGEAWTEAKNVNAKKRMRLEWKCIFVGSKDSLTRTSKLCYIVVEANKQQS